MNWKQRLTGSLMFGIPGAAGLVYFAGWKIAVCVFLMMWGDNHNNKRYKRSEFS